MKQYFLAALLLVSSQAYNTQASQIKDQPVFVVTDVKNAKKLIADLKRYDIAVSPFRTNRGRAGAWITVSDFLNPNSPTYLKEANEAIKKLSYAQFFTEEPVWRSDSMPPH